MIDRGYRTNSIYPFECLDFLECKRVESRRDIITNPPFSLATEFILQSKYIAHQKIAMFGRVNLLEGVDRHKKLWCEEANKNFPLSRVLCFTRRQKMIRKNVGKKDGSALIFFAWFVWDRKHKGQPIIEWI